jgi:hypothetical protein
MHGDIKNKIPFCMFKKILLIKKVKIKENKK